MKKSKIEMKFSTRDVVILLVVVLAAAIYAWWSLLISPLRDTIATTAVAVVEKEEELQREEANLRRLEALREEPQVVLNKIDAIAAGYSPENTVQFYYDLLSKKAQSLDLEINNISARLVSKITANETSMSAPVQTGLAQAIADYESANTEPGDNDEGSALPPTPVIGRLEFKYVPFEFLIGAEDFEQLQEFIRIIWDEEMSIYFPNATYTARSSELGMNFAFTIYFICIETLRPPVDPPVYET